MLLKEDGDQVHRNVLKASGLAKEYPTPAGKVEALRRADLVLHRGEMVALMGPSGVGKSTLLFILGLLIHPSRGDYELLGRDMLGLDRSAQARIRRKTVGFVFQSSDMIESGTLFENLEFPLVYADVPRSERPRRIEQALAKVELTHRIDHVASRLSGGERQRAAIARALVNHPDLILADEPTGQLDNLNAGMVMEYFAGVASDAEAAILIATHDETVARRCHRICRMKGGVLEGWTSRAEE